MSGRTESGRVALGGIVAALCIVIMFLPVLLPGLYIAAPMAAGILMIILAEEVSAGWAWLTYLTVSLLSLIVTFDKETALMFILFFGYYPILRPKLEKIRPKVLRLPVKLVLFNIFLLLDYWFTVYVLGLPTFDEETGVMLTVLALLANAVFLGYDIMLLSQMHWFYQDVFMKRMLGRRRK